MNSFRGTHYPLCHCKTLQVTEDRVQCPILVLPSKPEVSDFHRFSPHPSVFPRCSSSEASAPPDVPGSGKRNLWGSAHARVKTSSPRDFRRKRKMSNMYDILCLLWCLEMKWCQYTSDPFEAKSDAWLLNLRNLLQPSTQSLQGIHDLPCTTSAHEREASEDRKTENSKTDPFFLLSPSKNCILTATA